METFIFLNTESLLIPQFWETYIISFEITDRAAVYPFVTFSDELQWKEQLEGHSYWERRIRVEQRGKKTGIRLNLVNQDFLCLGVTKNF